MVVRIFRATPKASELNNYEKILIDESIPYMRQQKGCLQARVLKSLGVVREILFITTWNTLESIKEFAGDNWNVPVLIGLEADMIEGEAEVKHYHVISEF